MDEFTLRRMLKCLACKLDINTYVIAKNEFHLISYSKFPVIVIYNESKRGDFGSHWISLILYEANGGGGVYADIFDSLGLHKELSGIKFPSRVRKINTNTCRVQPLSSLTCGMYCLYFLYYRLRNFSMDRILSNFGNNYTANDKRVEMFYARVASLCRRDQFCTSSNSSSVLSCCTKKYINVRL